MMAKDERPKLPRGLHWDRKSPFIFLTGEKQHHQSTGTDQPGEALSFKLDFLSNREAKLEELEAETEDWGKLALSQVTEMYFAWKSAKNSPATLVRERRIFQPALKWLGAARIVKTIKLVHLRQYQQQRRSQVSKNTKQPVTERTVNYELDLLRGLLKYAGCWTPELATGYQALPELRSKVGKAATVEQLARIIKTARGNESWEVALYAAAVAIGTGCRGGKIRTLHIGDIRLPEEHIVIRRDRHVFADLFLALEALYPSVGRLGNGVRRLCLAAIGGPFTRRRTSKIHSRSRCHTGSSMNRSKGCG